YRGAQPPGVCRTDVLLQDRRCVPRMAQRPPGRVPDDRWPALCAQPAAPLGDRSPRERRQRAREARARRAAVERLPAPERSHRVTHPRLSINQATIKYTTVAQAIEVVQN